MMSHIRVRNGYVLLKGLLKAVCKALLKYREYQATIQTPEAMTAWDGLMTACEVFLDLVVDPRTISE